MGTLPARVAYNAQNRADMKNKISFKPRTPSTIVRLTRHAAVNDRRRRLSLWQFYQATGELETEQRVVETVRTEPSSR